MANIKPTVRAFMYASFLYPPHAELRRISLGRRSLLVLGHISNCC